MNEFEYKLATDLDHAWLNFEPDIPLKPLPDGSRNPFYVTRPDNETDKLKQALLRPYHRPPKHFFSGHRGCGKSTELFRLAADPAIKARFWTVHFSIRDLADINDLDFKDVLLIIGQQLFEQYREGGGKLPDQLLNELSTWRGELEAQITTLRAGRMEGELGAKLSAGFAELASKIKLEPRTRHEIRQVFDRNVTELVGLIDQIAVAIQAREKKPPLVLIDDLDKPDLAIARAIFFERQEIMLRPMCPIVYTVSSPLFYDPAFPVLRADSTFLPNVKLHEQGDAEARYAEGFLTLKNFIHQRMKPELIDEEALELATAMSGGVFRELTRIVRLSISRAAAVGRDTITVEDVHGAVREIGNTYRRILTGEEWDLLRAVSRHNELRDPEQLASLLQMLAVLEYNNGTTWCDVHPVIRTLLQ